MTDRRLVYMPEDNQLELFYLVDKDDNEIGSISRTQAHSSPDFIHRCVQIIIQNSKNQILLQQRSAQKDLYPLHWTVSASGHVTFGNTYTQAAERELFEEIGIKTALTFKTKHLISNDRESEMIAVFTGIYEELPNNIDPFEVKQVKWIDITELKEFISNNPITFETEAALKALNLIN